MAAPSREVLGRNEPEPGLRALGTGSGLARPPLTPAQTPRGPGGGGPFSPNATESLRFGENSQCSNGRSLLLPGGKRGLSPVPAPAVLRLNQGRGFASFPVCGDYNRVERLRSERAGSSHCRL